MKSVFLGIILILGIILLVGSILHATLFTRKRNAIQPYGQLVDVYDGKMHVYKQGSGPQTIVVLAGLGASLPCAEFGPLLRALKQDYTVVCVEYFGVGFSSTSKRERTVSNMVEEIRMALTKADIQGPYVLIPHSISSLLSEAYASMYPEEVRAILSLDGTSSAYLDRDMPSFVKQLLGIAKIQQATGIPSLLAPLTVHRNELLSDGYTQQEIDDLVVFAGFVINDNLLDQMRNTTQFVVDTNAMTYPKRIPYFKFISKQTYENNGKGMKCTPQEYQQAHLARVGAESNFEILEGSHFLYLNQVPEIVKQTKRFLAQIHPEG